MMDRVYIYDTTLRDGAQTQGVDFGVADKIAIAEALDRLGIDYVEGGWPGANPIDDAFFAAKPTLSTARLSAFGMTRRSGRSAANDPALSAVLNAGTPVVCMVAKAWDFQVTTALGVSLDENIAMIADSVALAAERCDEVMMDAEHFFDGYKADPAYARLCVQTALDAGARWVVLCDTNGGTLPHEIAAIVEALTAEQADGTQIPGSRLGIHCHNDSDTAVAGSLAAVHAGVRQVQGTINGLGERCGNANLISLIADLSLKMGMDTGVDEDGLKTLTHVSRMLDERLNRPAARHAPFVGDSAFAHKGGLHASAVSRDPRTYEHVTPDTVGNRRVVVVSDQSGRANILARFRDLGVEVDEKGQSVHRLVETVKEREAAGYTYDDAAASFELLARRSLGGVPRYFDLTSFRVLDERRLDSRGQTITLSEATMKVRVGDDQIMTVAEGKGPVDALASGLRKALAEAYPELTQMRLVDYKVRILSPEAGTAAVVRVMIESTDESGQRWSTVGVSDNLIAASYDALHDAVSYRLFRGRQQAGVSPGEA